MYNVKQLFLFFSFALFLSGKGLLAQDPHVTWGEPKKLQKRHYGKEILLEDDDQVYMISRKSNDVNLLFFTIKRDPDLFLQTIDSKTFKQKSHVQLRFPSKEVNYLFKILKMEKVGGRRYLFFKATDERAEVVKLLVQEITEEGMQKGKVFELDQTQIESGFSLFSQRKEGDFDVILSPDACHLAVLRVDPFNEGIEKQIHLTVLNDSLQLEWSGTIDLPYKEEFFELKNYALSNEKELFVLGKVFKTEEIQSLGGKTKTRVIRPGEGSPNYRYTFFVFRTSTLNSKEFDLNLPGKFVTDINFSFDYQADHIRLAGFYSKKWGEGIGGTFSTSINHQTGVVAYSHLKDFSPAFLELFESDRSYEESRQRGGYYAELSDFRMDDFIVKPDGGAYLVAENYYIVVNTSTIRDQYGYNRTTTSYTYHYDDLVVVYMSPNGKVEWSAKIPKKQLSYNDDGPYSSYLLNVEEDKVWLVFNDHKDNAERYVEGKSPKNMGNPKRSIVTCVSIDDKGIMNRRNLFSAAEEDIVFRPKSSWYPRDKYKSNRIYIFGVDYGLFTRTKFKMGAIDFPTAEK